MKKSYLLLISILFIFFAGLFTSCDYLLPAPLGRNNLLDDKVQIGRFYAASSSFSSFIIFWDWRNPPEGIDSSRIIDKIRIVYRENSYPVSKYPLNPDHVVEFSSNSTFTYVWDNMNNNMDHYFSLYAHEKGGIWLAPKTISAWINNSGYYENWPWSNTKLYVSALADSNTIGPTTLNIVNDPGIPLVNIGFMRFDDLFNSDYGAIVDARIQGWSITNGGVISIVPVRKRVDSTMTWGDINDPVYFDNEHAKSVTIISSTDIVNIMDQINISRVYGSNTIAFITNDDSVSIDISSVTFNDGTNDLFKIWRNNP